MLRLVYFVLGMTLKETQKAVLQLTTVIFEFNMQSSLSTNKVHYYRPLSHYICTIKIENERAQLESILNIVL